MDFIRNLFTLFQRLQEIVRDGQKRRDIPGMATALFGELRGAGNDSNGEGDGPAVYQGKRAQADQATPAAASRATARNRASSNSDLPEPAVYRSPQGAQTEPEFAPVSAPARNADDKSEKWPEPAAATPLAREDYDYQPASAAPSDAPGEPEFEPAAAPVSQAEEATSDDEPATLTWDDEEEEREAKVEQPRTEATTDAPVANPPAPTPAPAASADAGKRGVEEEDDDWFDLDDWQGTALKVAGLGAAAAGTAAGAMAIKNHFFDEEDEEDGTKPALPLGGGDEPMVEQEKDGGREWAAAAAVAAPAVAAVLPKAGEAGQADDSEKRPSAPAEAADDDSAPQQPRRPQEVEIIPADPRHPSTQPASQSLANPGIRLYGAMDAKMYSEFTERLAEQTPGGPIVIALTTMEGDPEIARSMADDIRLLRDRGRREIIFLGKTAVYSAGVLFMAAFPVSHRYLTRATKLLVTENKRAQPMELAGGSLRSVASQLEHAQREIQREIEQEDDDYRAISEGSNVSIQELREKAPHDWHITASEAKAMGLIAEVV
ncbi:ATP-dependent Clp protease proteolytic subunit [Citromicrobium bathyomarinum]|uniref:ATP-dependent Clp protease proteolytic subunit n=1 Tax=Citromicrobium bathyomarinum TaxID=72174 RepID=UPI00315A2311